jgi:hypothetical protein
LADTLLSLRITLSSAKLSWLKEFIDNKGLLVLESILEKHTIRDKKRSAKTLFYSLLLQHICIHSLNLKLVHLEIPIKMIEYNPNAFDV